MRFLSTILLTFVCLLSSAQTMVAFHVTPDGSFISPDGDDFVVVKFENKSAHEIFQSLASNVSSLYNDPSKVMSTVDDASIKIRAMETICANKGLGITIGSWIGYYQLDFKIKDGRVRVSAPVIEHYMKDSNFKKPDKSYPGYVKGFFKDGELKENKKDEYEALNFKFNLIINSILGLTKSEKENDW